MYNFKKVRNAQRFPEFQHPLFRPNGLEAIKTIKRKINPAFSDSEVISKLKRPGFSLKKECQTLRQRNESLGKLLAQLKGQNEKCSQVNHQIYCKLSFLKGISTFKSMKLLFVIFSLANDFSPKLLFDIRKTMMEFGGCVIDDNIDILDVFVKLRKVCSALRQQLSDSSYWGSRLLDQIVDITCKGLTSKEELEADNHLQRLFQKIDHFFQPKHLTSFLIKPEIDISKTNEIVDEKIEEMKRRSMAGKPFFDFKPDNSQESFINAMSCLYPSDNENLSDSQN